MSGREFDVMDSDAPDDDGKASGSGPRPGRGWGTYGLVMVVASAVVIGGVIGVHLGQQRESSRRQAADRSTLSLTSAVVPGATAHPPEQDIATVVQQIELALINTGPELVSDVAVSWDTVHQAYSTGAEGKVTLSNLSPGEPQRVQLTLRQPCATPALPGVGQVPQLVVSARTPDGHSRQVTLQPLGLDSIWASMRSACPVNDNATETTTVHVIATQRVGPDSARLTLSFDNPASVDVLITEISITRGVDSSTEQVPTSLQVFPHFSAQAKVLLTITDCRAAVLDPTPVEISYVVASADAPEATQPTSVGNSNITKAVATVVYDACVTR